MYTPHTYAAPTLGVRKNMLSFRSTKNSAPTLELDKNMFGPGAMYLDVGLMVL